MDTSLRSPPSHTTRSSFSSSAPGKNVPPILPQDNTTMLVDLLSGSIRILECGSLASTFETATRKPGSATSNKKVAFHIDHR